LSVLYNFYMIILVQQNYFSDPYPAKILDLSAKPFFPCMICCIARSLEGKSPRGCVRHIVASYLSPRSSWEWHFKRQTSSPFSPSARFRRSVSDCACAHFFHRIHFTREAELESEKGREMIKTEGSIYWRERRHEMSGIKVEEKWFSGIRQRLHNNETSQHQRFSGDALERGTTLPSRQPLLPIRLCGVSKATRKSLEEIKRIIER